MTIQAYPTLNGVEPSWADVAFTVTVGGIPIGGLAINIADIAAMKWARKVEVGEKRGTSGGRVMSRTTGQGSQEASATFYRSGVRALERALVPFSRTRGNQVLIGLVSFDVTVQHTPPGEVDIYQTVIKGCRYLGDSDDMKEGFDADKVEVTLNPIEIVKIVDGREIVLL